MKTCIKCYQEKELTEFHKNSGMRDNHLNTCKVCQLNITTEYTKKYRQTKQGKIKQRKYAQCYRQSEKGKIAQRNFRIRHPECIKAGNAITIAIRCGKLPHPFNLTCHYCLMQAKQYHHYKGYAPEYQLDVIPVCKSCHTKLHWKIAI